MIVCIGMKCLVLGLVVFMIGFGLAGDGFVEDIVVDEEFNGLCVDSDLKNYCGNDIYLYSRFEFQTLYELISSSIEWTIHVIMNSSNERVYDVYAVDLDSDGDMDVLSANYNYEKVVWYENDGEENFTAHSLPLPTWEMQGIISVYAEDIDSDGDMDVLSASIHGGKVGWHENDGRENFTFHYITTSAREVYDAYASDLDSDGDIDVLSANYGDNKIVWYENDGRENFTAHVISNLALGARDVHATDLDMDGDMDVLSASKNDNKIAWYENDGEGNFATRIITTNASDARSVYTIDLDSDGDVDVLSASSNDNKIAWYENDGSQTFVTHIITSSAGWAESVYASDIDSDGDMDVFSANSLDDSIIWYENNGRENFIVHLIDDSMIVANSVYLEDIDSDGDMDVLSTSWMSSKVSWYENDFTKGSFCNGSVNVYIGDSDGNYMDGLYVYSEKDYGVSDIDGFVSLDLSQVSCGEIVDVEVRCSDEVRVCDVCREGFDFWIDEDELRFENVDGDVRVNVSVHSLGLSKDVDVSLVKRCGGVKSLVETRTVSILEGKFEVVSFVDDFDGCEKIDIMVEHFEAEDYSGNNVILDYPVVEPVMVYLEVDSGYAAVDEVIEEFVGDYVEVVSSRNEADLDVYIGKSFCLASNFCQDYLSGNLIRFEGRREGLPYNGLIVDGNREVFVFGNEIDGLIAGVRRLVDDRGIYLNERNSWLDLDDVYLDSESLDALSVYDFLHTDENVGVYRKDNEAFGKVVGDVLRRDVFNLEVKRVLTKDGVSLRMKNLASEFSEGFRNFVGMRPVVMAGGLFNDLETWESQFLAGNGLAIQLAEEGRDVWEIEITGGSGTECEECVDYSYADLVDSYWPALMAGVQYHTGAVSLDYVGFSNGCRVALSSLESYQEKGKENVGSIDGIDVDLEGSSSARVVDSFVGVGCPGAFEGESYLMEQVGDHPDSVEDLRGEGKGHVDKDDVAKRLHLLGRVLPGGNSISLNLWSSYVDFIFNYADSQPGNFDVDRARIIYGFGGVNGWGDDERDDGMVTEVDAIAIVNNINSINTDDIESYEVSHQFLTANNNIIIDIRRFLENGN